MIIPKKYRGHNTYKFFGHCKHEFKIGKMGMNYCHANNGCSVFKGIWDEFLIYVKSKGKIDLRMSQYLGKAHLYCTYYAAKDLKKAHSEYKKTKKLAPLLKVIEETISYTK